MLLSAGTRLGPYEILAPLGAGGMGEVYKALDTRLDRAVAIKVLPQVFVSDSERVARFQREAKTLAALNHPNIGCIYGLEGADGVTALVLELVEGPTLADRIAQGPVPLDEALPIARQIAEALEAAHEQGIIHRDLKPANIKIRPDGTVKVLDFGLAKAFDPAASGPSVTNSPTLSMQATQAGIILGTAAYMSPEQARGKPVDRRADIWAFGAVLYEMLTGCRAFEGDDISITLASVLKTDPDWKALPPATPAGLRRLISRCLKKDPKDRVQAIGDARIEIGELLLGDARDEAVATRPAMPRRSIAAAASVALAAGLVIAASATWVLMRPAPPTLHPMRFTIVAPAAGMLTGPGGSDRNLVLSPDGTHLVYVGGVGERSQLLVRAIDQLDAVPLRGITGARNPFLSPDGRWVGFFTAAGHELKKVSISGGPPVSLCQVSGQPRGASWGPDNTIVFATSDPSTGLLRVSAAGGQPTVLTTPDPAHSEQDHLFPSVLPGGRAVLFTINENGPLANAQLAVLDLKTGRRKTLIRGGSQAEYVDPGYLVYAVAAVASVAGTLRAVRFDPVRLEVLSDPVPVVDQVTTLGTGAAEFTVSRQGALVYVLGSAGATRSLVWVDRQGHEDPITAAPPRVYALPRLSPDGTRVAIGIRDQEDDIWIWDLARQTLTRLTDAPAPDTNPVWTPDGRRIIFASQRAGTLNLFWQAADNTGTVERLTTGSNPQSPTSISPDGTRLVFREVTPKTGPDLKVLRIETSPAGRGAGERPTEPLVQTTFAEDNGEVSPDGRWLAYQSNESGGFQIYVRPFPNTDTGHWQISTIGGTRPLWARSGRELFYLDGSNAMTSVPVHTTPTFSPGIPTTLFGGRYLNGPTGRSYDASLDGQRFLMIKVKDNAGGDESSASLVVVLNWAEELKRLVPTK